MDSLNNSTKSTPASRSWGGFFYDVAVSTGNFIYENPYTTALIVGGVVAAGVGAYPYFFGSATAAAVVASPDAVVATAVTTAKAATAVTTAKAATAVKVTAATAATAVTAAKAAVATAVTAATVATVATAAKAVTAATANRPDLTLQQIIDLFNEITLPRRVATDLFTEVSVPPAVSQELCPNSPQLGAMLAVTMALASYVAAHITSTSDPLTVQAGLRTLFGLINASDTFRQLSVGDQALVMECATRTFYTYLPNDLDLAFLRRLSTLFAQAASRGSSPELILKMQSPCSGVMQEVLNGVDREELLVTFFRKLRGN